MNTTKRARFAALAAAALLICSARELSAQETVRAVVQLRADVEFEPYARDFAPDARTSSSDSSTYHRREVVGAAQHLEKKVQDFARRISTATPSRDSPPLSRVRNCANSNDPLVETVEIETVISLGPVLPAADPSQVIPWGMPKIGADIGAAGSGNDSGTSRMTLYIVDTGIDAAHSDLNVVGHMSFLSGVNPTATAMERPCLASRLRATTRLCGWSRARAPLVGIKVMTCDGLTFPSVVVQALDWLTANAVKPAVVNLTSARRSRLRPPTRRSARRGTSGLVLAIAAGNGNPFSCTPMNTCVTSPASAGYFYGIPNGVITAAATDENDRGSELQQFRHFVDIWAPAYH